MKLIADGGSTGAKWALITSAGDVMEFTTPGVNPAVMGAEQIRQLLMPGLAQALENACEPVESLEYYGAGCLPGAPSDTMAHLLTGITGAEHVVVASDMLGACRALLGGRPGIVAILGTGSNSCCYDGRGIVAGTAAGGYILGDEFSGAWLGKHMVADWLKGLLPPELAGELENRGLTPNEVIRRVYRPDAADMAPNRFLASLAPICSDHRGNRWVESTLRAGAESFVVRNLLKYKAICSDNTTAVNFVGSVAVAFADLLGEVLPEFGFSVGRIIRTALPDLVANARIARSPGN